MVVDGRALGGEGGAEESAQEGIEGRHEGCWELIIAEGQGRGGLGAELGGGELVRDAFQCGL